MIKSLLKKVAVAVALASAFGAASAATYNAGTLSSTKTFSNIQIANTFDDIFTFTAGNQQSVLGSFVAISRGGFNLDYRFGLGTVLSGAWLQAGAQPAGSVSLSETFSGLIAGQTYSIELKGTAARGAAYSVTLAPVPEPESYAMLLAGLGLMGAIARRRNNAKSTKSGA